MQHRAGKGQETELGAKGQGSRGAAQTRSLEDSLSHVTTGGRVLLTGPVILTFAV